VTIVTSVNDLASLGHPRALRPYGPQWAPPVIMLGNGLVRIGRRAPGEDGRHDVVCKSTLPVLVVPDKTG
jgi:hypothetical protein